MVAVDRISQEKPYNFQGQDKRKDAAQGVAAGVGATGAISYQAKRAATKNGLRSVFTKVNNGSKVVRENAGEISSLYNKFTKDIQRFSKSLMARFAKMKTWKFIGPLVKSPVARGVANGFGVVMAFFALITGVRKAVDNGRLAVGDLKDKLNMAA